MHGYILLWVAVVWVMSPAAWTLATDDFLISADLSHAEQNRPSITVNMDGAFAIAWEDYRNGHSDVYCQLFDSATGLRGGNIIVNDDVEGAWQFEPFIVSDWAGSYYLVWKDYRSSGYPFDPDVYFQRLGPDGRVGSNINITDEAPDSSRQSPSIDVTGWGRAVVCWTDLRNNNWDVFVRLLDTSGAGVSASYRANDDVGYTPQHEPDIAIAPDGWYVVVWYDKRSGYEDIYMQQYDSGGNTIGGNIRVNEVVGTTKQKFPSVAVGDNGRICVVWTDWRNGYPENSDIYCQLFDSALNRIGANRMVNTPDGGTAQRHPQVAIDHMGTICVVWSDSSDGDWNIRGQIIGPSGELQGGNFGVNVDRPGRQLHPDVAMDGYRAYFSWADDRNGDFDIYGRIMQYNHPRLTADPDYIERIYVRGGATKDTTVVFVESEGYGEVAFDANADQAWLTLSASSGRTPDTLAVIIDYAMTQYGTHRGSVTLIDSAGTDSSLRISVVVSVSSPMIATVPEALTEVLYGHESRRDSVQVRVVGSEGGSWIASQHISWLTPGVFDGGDGDFLTCDISGSSLAAGIYSDQIIIEDTSAGNSPYALPCSLTVLTTDTVGTVAVEAEPGQAFRQQFILKAHHNLLSGDLTCAYEPAMISVDSFTLSAGSDSTFSAHFVSEDASSRFGLHIESAIGQEAIPAADYYLGDVWCTANDSLTGTTMISIAGDSVWLELESYGVHTPAWAAEPIEITTATDVEQPLAADEKLPIFMLHQNRPNPFNSTTEIAFSLGRSGPVQVHVYNILGQLVRVVADGNFGAGPHTVSWDGRDASGREMPSGIFFYKLLTPDDSAVKKMVLLK